MATPFPATSTCPVSRGCLGRRTPFTFPFGEGLLPQPPQAFPGRRVGGFWQTNANVHHGVAGGQCGHGCFPSHGDGPVFLCCHRYGDGPASPASGGFHRYGPGDPLGPLVHPAGVGRPLGWAVVSPTIYGWTPPPHPGTAALVSLTVASVLPTAAGHSGPGSGSSGQDALLAGSAPQPPSSGSPPVHPPPQGVPVPRRGRILPTEPLSLRIFTAAGPSAARVISGIAGSHSTLRVITRTSPTVTLPRGRSWMKPPNGAWMSHQPTSSSGPLLPRSCMNMPHLHWSRVGEGGGGASHAQAPCLTAAELALGAVAQPSPPPHPPPPSLRESSMVATAVRRVQEEARACNTEATPQSVLDFPGALPSRKLFRPGKPLFMKGVPLSHLAIPSATLHLSQDDMLLIPERSCLSKSPRLACIPEQSLANWEEMARRGLESTSVMGSFLAMPHSLAVWLGRSGIQSQTLSSCDRTWTPLLFWLSSRHWRRASRPLLTSSPGCISIPSWPGGIRPCQPLLRCAHPLCAPPFTHCR